MTAGWWLAIVGAVALGWSMFLDARYRSGDRLARWWVPRAKSWGRWAGPVSFLLSAGALLAYVGVVLAGSALASALGGDAVALLVALPAILVYTPFAFETMPARGSGYLDWRSSLAAAGADERLQRRIAWWAGPPSVAGLAAMIVTLLAIIGD